ncbi:MAG: insulinase family protein [Lachnospiraceae bacterium]
MKLENLTAYEVLENHYVEELDSQAYRLRHKKTGARLLLLENKDDNKVFNIAFRTVPTDSTGVAHIIEHTVLCGSDKFPVKDPFVELIKGSLNTFLNAITYPDKTMYPCASTNDKDFKNLMEVYMDAVFHPNIYKTEKIFRQEGWHYELESVDGPLTYNGVVYNEMKGALSSGDSLINNLVYEKLFPHTTYANESGGNPAAIPDLTYEQYLDFHRTYYHPSNSYIYLYGDMDMEERLLWLDKEYLSKYDYLKVNSEIAMEPAFTAPVYGEINYGITEDEPEENATYLTWARVTGSCLDVKQYMAMNVLEYVLLNAPGAPLKQALQDANVGNDISGGIMNSTRQMIFEIDVRGSEYEKKELFETTIQESLQRIVKEGINKKSLLAGINAMEFKSREADYGRYPKGLMYVLQAFDTWLYDDEMALDLLEYNQLFAFLKEQVDTNYYEQLIQTCLIDNPHGVVAVAKPKRGLTAEQDAKTAKILADYKASLSPEELERLVKETAELKAYQEAPSSKEDLEKIPMISVADIRKEARNLENVMEYWEEIPVLTHPIFTSGISYLTLLFQADTLELEDLPYINLIRNILSYVDTEKYGFQELSDEINIHTGGIDLGYNCYQKKDLAVVPIVTSEVRIKALDEKISYALDLVEEILFHSVLDDEKRLNEIVGEIYSRTKYRIQNSGNSVAISRANSYYSVGSCIAEKIGGLSYYDFLGDVIKQLNDDYQVVVVKLREIIQKLYRRENLMISYTAEKPQIEHSKEKIMGFVNQLSRKNLPKTQWNVVLEKKNEGLKSASQVNYVARCGDFSAAGYEYVGAMRVMKSIMDYDYLWINLRVKGGAYGCMSGMGLSGSTYFCSYRDPNVAATNEVYEQIPAYLEQFDADERDMTKYIIGTISEMDTPMNPSAQGDSGLSCYLRDISDEMLQKERDEVLHTTVEDIRRLAEPVRSVLAQDIICAVGNDEAIERDKAIFKEVKSLF